MERRKGVSPRPIRGISVRVMKAALVCGLVGMLLEAVIPRAVADTTNDFIIFRARSQDYVVANPLFGQLRSLWTSTRSDIEASWKAEVDAKRITWDFWIGTFTVGARETSVSIQSNLPAISIQQGADKRTLGFSTSFQVDWTTHICAPFGGLLECLEIDYHPSFHTTITISGTLRLDQIGRAHV